MGNTKSNKYTPTEIEQNFIDKYLIPDTLAVRQVPAGGSDISVTKEVYVDGETDKVVLEALFMRDSFRWYSQLNDDDFYMAHITTGTEEQEANPNWANKIEKDVKMFLFDIVKAFKAADRKLYVLPNPVLLDKRYYNFFGKYIGKYITVIGKDSVNIGKDSVNIGKDSVKLRL